MRTGIYAVALATLGLLLPVTTADATATGNASPADTFTEQLLIHPLNADKFLSHFDFTVTAPLALTADHPEQHYRLFPRLIGQIVQRYGIREFHLTFGQGHWDYERWGYPVEPSTPPSLELWARLVPSEDIETRWNGFTNALSGLFCASINFIDQTTLVEPRLSFRSAPSPPSAAHADKHNDEPKSDHDNARNHHGDGAGATTVLRHALLAKENVCTENLTPWTKLLPCQTKAGLTTLLNSYQLYDTDYHSMGIHVTLDCAASATCHPEAHVTLRQTLSVVFDRVRLGLDTGTPDILDTLFKRSLRSACPLATSSQLAVVVPHASPWQLTVGPSYWAKAPLPQYGIAVFDLQALLSKQQNQQQQALSSLTVPLQQSDSLLPPTTAHLPAGVTVHRHITGQGMERGGLLVHLFNRLDHAVSTVYMDALPWYLNVHLHTLRIQRHTLATTPANAVSDLASHPFSPTTTLFQPSQDHGRPTVLELQLEIPAQSLLTLSLNFDKMFLKYTEHPPDANRGFNVGSAVLTASLPPLSTNSASRGTDGPASSSQVLTSCDYRTLLASLLTSSVSPMPNRSVMFAKPSAQPCLTRVYSEPFLVNLPTPDFSMPYNVIAFTCTVLAFFFGSMFNALTRGYVVLGRDTNA
ncbi:Subunit of the glycosylphosphatidylinositol transamidase complex-like protein [Dimargaris verticillata]|uniref:Subunit of the glycosylphosphatidylinositol transamidase complex-like protein n=1 Tax=Dimargaris verticillata TaxID=2761393 RepID=A0A9W8BBG1_9FUNG|nr:Subunit of the glycosylphosphatidylinositol transamidase complex-like protein [Dimargaris verticillata]